MSELLDDELPDVVPDVLPSPKPLPAQPSDPDDPNDVLEAALAKLDEDSVARAYVTRLDRGPRGMTRTAIGRPFDLSADEAPLSQVIDLIEEHSAKSGTFEIKLKCRGQHLASVRVPLELRERQAPPRQPNPAPAAPVAAASPLSPLRDAVTQLRELEELKRELREDEDEDDDDAALAQELEDALEEDADDEEDEEEDSGDLLIRSLASVFTSETTKMIAGRLAVGLANYVDAATEVKQAVAQGKIPLAGPGPKPSAPAPRPEEPDFDPTKVVALEGWKGAS